jgi:hypothetical protein
LVESHVALISEHVTGSVPQAPAGTHVFLLAVLVAQVNPVPHLVLVVQTQAWPSMLHVTSPVQEAFGIQVFYFVEALSAEVWHLVEPSVAHPSTSLVGSQVSAALTEVATRRRATNFISYMIFVIY